MIKITIEIPKDAADRLQELIKNNDPKWLAFKKEFGIEEVKSKDVLTRPESIV